MRLKKIRMTKGMTQTELARSIGASQNAVCNWETGVRVPRVKMLVKIADALSCSVDDILGDGDTEKGGRADAQDNGDRTTHQVNRNK